MRTFPAALLPLLLSPMLSACRPEIGGEGATEAECTDGLDNDGDEAYDCLDAGCMDYDVCQDDTGSPPDDTDDTHQGDPDITNVSAVADPEVTVNEFMASNQTTIEDAEYPDTWPDWIELYNTTDQAIDLEGYSLTDDFTACDKSPLPEGVSIAAHGFLLLWADHDQEEGALHLDFALSKGGEQIALCRPDMTPLTKIEYEEQQTDISVARIPDGGQTWEFDDTPTPGEANEL
ncbi:MAG: lamin tail domain-containing protein [Pseudomonadota bacterium]